MAPETNNHELQICHRAYAPRMKHHDAVASYICRNVRCRGVTVEEEPRFMTTEGARKPNIVDIVGDLGVVIDLQVAGDQSDLEQARRAKIIKYSENFTIDQEVTHTTRATNIKHLPVILSCTGKWCRTSAEDSLRLGNLKKRNLAVIASRVLIGDHA